MTENQVAGASKVDLAANGEVLPETSVKNGKDDKDKPAEPQKMVGVGETVSEKLIILISAVYRIRYRTQSRCTIVEFLCSVAKTSFVMDVQI